MQPGADGRRKLDRTGHRAESIMRLADCYLQHIGRSHPALGVWELDVEVDLDTGETVAVPVLGVLARAVELESAGFGPFDGYGIDIHRCASGNRDQQQLDRAELPRFGVAERERAAAGIHCLVVKPAQPGQRDRTVRVPTHAPTLADSQDISVSLQGELYSPPSRSKERYGVKGLRAEYANP